jgi:uncharacterized protein
MTSELRKFRKSHIDSLALGSAVLGSGGGGNPYLGALLLKSAMERFHVNELEVTPFDELDDSDFSLCNAGMGSPTIGVEKIPSGTEYARSTRSLEKILGRKATHLSPAEIGGINSLVPFINAVYVKLPVIDGDGEGRAFPELQMTTFNAYGQRASPLCISDEKGNEVIINGVSDPWAEKLARAVTVSMGGRGCVASHPMDGTGYRKSAIPSTLSLALKIGESLLEGMKKKDAEESLRNSCDAKELFIGKVIDLKRYNQRGFAIGHVLIEGLDQYRAQQLKILFQNEFLIAKRLIEGNEDTLVTTPQIISIHDLESLLPITTDQLRYGNRCKVFQIPVAEKWLTPQAIKLVSPTAFNLS